MMSHLRLYKILALHVVLLLVPLVTYAVVDSPTAQVKHTVDKVISLLTNPSLQGTVKKAERHTLLRETIFARFDFQEMAKRSLGFHWRRRTVHERKQFVVLFRDLLEKVYVDRIDSFNDERFIYINENIDEPYAEVTSKILTAKGEEFSIEYKLHRVGEQWKIYDVVVEDISLVNNYRSQFNRIISKSSYDELVQKMQRKLAETEEN